jgi:hypothetical protein
MNMDGLLTNSPAVQSQSRWHSNLERTVHPMLTKCRIRARDICMVDKFLSSDWYCNSYFFHTQAVPGVYERILYYLSQREFEAKSSRVQGKEPGGYLYVCYCEPKLMISFPYAEKLPPGFFFLRSSPEKMLYLFFLWRGTRLGPTVRHVQIQRAGRCITCTPLYRLLSPDRSGLTLELCKRILLWCYGDVFICIA